MTEASGILDAIDAPGVIGSMLDSASARLESLLDRDEQTAIGVQTRTSQVEREFNAVLAATEFKPDPWDTPVVCCGLKQHRHRSANCANDNLTNLV